MRSIHRKNEYEDAEEEEEKDEEEEEGQPNAVNRKGRGRCFVGGLQLKGRLAPSILVVFVRDGGQVFGGVFSGKPPSRKSREQHITLSPHTRPDPDISIELRDLDPG